MPAFSEGRRLKALCDRAGALGIPSLHDEMYYDEGTDSLVVMTSQDVTPILDRNKELANPGLHGDGYSPSRDLRRAASIPLIVVHQWFREGINVYDQNDWPAVKRKLNDPEYAYLRTAPGKL